MMQARPSGANGHLEVRRLADRSLDGLLRRAVRADLGRWKNPEAHPPRCSVRLADDVDLTAYSKVLP